MQKRQKRIRRCQACGEKTHRRHWISPACPLCGEAEGWVSSEHGAIGKKEMRELLEGRPRIGKER